MFAINRYELSSVVHIKLLDLAIFQSFRENVSPAISSVLSEFGDIEKEEKNHIEKICKKSEEEQFSLILDSYTIFSKRQIEDITNKIFQPIIHSLTKLEEKCDDSQKIDWDSITNKFLNRSNILYNAYLVNLSSEFPEFTLWCDLNLKKEIQNEINSMKEDLSIVNSTLLSKNSLLSKIEITLSRIEQLRDDAFIEKTGFPTFNQNYEDLLKIASDSVEDLLDKKVKENFIAHQNSIKSELSKPLSTNEDIEGISYPKNKDIYIAQSFQSITYEKQIHKKGFLKKNTSLEKSRSGEDIGNYLLKLLVDPKSSLKPIVLLGNPGAGKSMLSKMFAAELSNTKDFIPFLIRLRRCSIELFESNRAYKPRHLKFNKSYTRNKLD